jgi:hypothetical protein
MHFVGGENSALRAWTLSANGGSTYQAGSNEIASPQSPRPPGGMPGWASRWPRTTARTGSSLR